MLQGLLLTLVVVWLLDGLALLATPRRVMSMLRQFLDTSGRKHRWWALTSALGLVLFWLPATFPYRPLWLGVGGAMLVKGVFVGLAPDRWRIPVLAWCLSREDIDYRFWGLGLCALAIVLGQSVGTMPLMESGR